MSMYSNHTAGRHGVRMATLLAALLLSACGGGGGSPGAVGGGAPTSGGSTGGGTGGGTTVTASPAVSVTFADTNGGASSSLSGATPLTVRATVLDRSKRPVPNAIVTFATDNELAAFSPSAGTALTDDKGVATVTMRAASLAAGGAGTVTATSTVAGTTVSGTGNYSVGATTLTFGTLTAEPSALQAYGSTVLAVDLMAGASKYTEQQVNVSFSSACVAAGKATLAQTVPTNSGTAQTVYRDKGCGNNDVITVTADGVTKSVTKNLTIAPPSAASVQFIGATPEDKSIVIQGQGGNGRTETANLTFKVVDIFGNALAGKAVEFTTTSPYVKINKVSDTTDASGSVITTVNSGSVPTSFRVQATLPKSGSDGKPDISTMSDSIVVTTGLPVQRAFSLSSAKFNVEGWSSDSSPGSPATTLQVMVADAFGNPVPDGTPVVFQTNMGSVGSSNKGGCNTVNGGCVVDFRTQEPRRPAPNVPATPCNSGTAPGVSSDSTRPGLATICASTSDGANTMFGKTAIFFSGSSAVNVTRNGEQVSFTTPNDLGSHAANVTVTFQLQMSDVNFNPMPVGSKVEITSMLQGVAAAVVPSTVPNIAPHITNANSTTVDDPTGMKVTGTQGSFHTFSVTSPNPLECKGPANTSFNVTLTTPSGIVTNIPFKVYFSCP